MEIQEIKQRLSIETVLNHYHIHPDRHNFLKCPFNDDQEPSLKIYPETNTFNCFGCGAAGDVIEFAVFVIVSQQQSRQAVQPIFISYKFF